MNSSRYTDLPLRSGHLGSEPVQGEALRKSVLHLPYALARVGGKVAGRQLVGFNNVRHSQDEGSLGH